VIVEQRIYTFHPGRLASFFELYEAEGRTLHTKYLPPPLGYFVSDSGLLNQVVSLWPYASHDERTRRRAALFEDPLWLAYVDKVRPLMSTQESRIFKPAPLITTNPR
jgi:hypothetical protein